MSKYIIAIFVGLLIAAVWGYFFDLQNGQIGWFIGRLVITPLVTVGVFWVFALGRKKRGV